MTLKKEFSVRKLTFEETHRVAEFLTILLEIEQSVELKKHAAATSHAEEKKTTPRKRKKSRGYSDGPVLWQDLFFAQIALSLSCWLIRILHRSEVIHGKI